MAKRHGRDDSDDNCDGQADKVCDGDRSGVIEEDPYSDWEDPPIVMFVIFTDPSDFCADIGDEGQGDNCPMEPNPPEEWRFEFIEPITYEVEWGEELYLPPDRGPEPFFLIDEGTRFGLEDLCRRYGFKADFDMDGIGDACDNDPDDDGVPDMCWFDANADQSDADKACPPANPDKDPND